MVLCSNYLVFLLVSCFIFNFNISFYSLGIMIDINDFFRHSYQMCSSYLIFHFVDPLKFNFNILFYFLKITINISDILYYSIRSIITFCYVVSTFSITRTKFKSIRETCFFTTTYPLAFSRAFHFGSHYVNVMK